MINIVQNQNFTQARIKATSLLTKCNPEKIEQFHKTLGNRRTPLVKLPELAKRLNIGNLLLKDESQRFGLNAFKALGASYAMHKQIEKNQQIKTFCTATDGNHGRAVAWMSKKLDKNCIIYMPKGAAHERIKAIEREGAEVNVIDEGYDFAVRMASKRVGSANANSKNGSWSLIQDTAWDGYEEIPLDIMKGYFTQVHEITKQIKKEKIDIILLQSGVGSWAASLIIYIYKYWKNIPLFISVEPFTANCLFESIKVGYRVAVENDNTTIMAGLNCGSVSTLAWKILKKSLIGSISISDKLTKMAMSTLAYPQSEDPLIISGESGASGLGALLGLCKTTAYKSFKKKICLNRNSTVLVINTEGDTDKANYQKVITEGIIK